MRKFFELLPIQQIGFLMHLFLTVSIILFFVCARTGTEQFAKTKTLTIILFTELDSAVSSF